MDGSASFPLLRIPTGLARTSMVGLLAAAFLLGGTGGYVVRGWSSAASSTTTTHTTISTHPFVTAPVPYSSPLPSPAQQPTLDPKGFTVPI